MTQSSSATSTPWRLRPGSNDDRPRRRDDPCRLSSPPAWWSKVLGSSTTATRRTRKRWSSGPVTILCSFSNAGGSLALGGTDWARSTDGGRTWQTEGTIVPAGTEPPTTNFLKLSRAPDRPTVYAYGARLHRASVVRFGERTTEPIMCASNDDGRHWSQPSVVPIPGSRLEITHGVLALPGGRLLAPAATIEAGRPGERVVVAVSTDDGATWPGQVEVFRDPAGERGYLEHKFTDLGDGHLLATAWTVRMADVVDLTNSYVVSHDWGNTWSAPLDTDIQGQTLSTVDLGHRRLLALYNRRSAEPGIVAAIVSLEADRWVTLNETLVYQPARAGTAGVEKGTDRFGGFRFGFPTAVRLPDGAVLATFWSRDADRTAVRWMRIHVSTEFHQDDQPATD